MASDYDAHAAENVQLVPRLDKDDICGMNMHGESRHGEQQDMEAALLSLPVSHAQWLAKQGEEGGDIDILCYIGTLMMIQDVDTRFAAAAACYNAVLA